MKRFHLLGITGFFTWVLVLICSIWLQLPSAVAQGAGEPGGTCSDSIPCYQGCCSKDNSCGFTDAHCGDGCKSNCNATSQCGEFAVPEDFDCPINVCCSSFGYCGVTPEFCGDGCQKNSNGGGCGQPDRPQCEVNADAMSYPRRIGYYELFNIDNECNVIAPESLIIEPFTHINLAFVNFGDDFKMKDMYGNAVDRVSFLKFTNPGLRVNVAVGGWAFSDPPTQYLWTQMARSYENRQTFINSVVKYLRNYHLDGIDIDWEYPSADDRGGQPQDAANFVTLVAEMRETFDRENPGWEISATLPTSYWYMRGFDLVGMQEYVDYFNIMSYDLHGMWDQDIKWTGPYLKGHTNITEIDRGLDLLWRNDIDPAKVVFGFAFYGRSFTMDDPNCFRPNGICKFSDGGKPGTCSATTGILTYAEISSRNNSLDVRTFYDPETTVKYNVYEGDQWISYDDEQSFFDKKKFVSNRCLGGWMVWAMDQDNGQFDALAGLIGEDLSTMQMEGGGLSDDAANALADTFAAYTGQDCFVTPRCTDGSSGEKGPEQVCPSGYLSVSTAHNPLQAGNKELHGDCAEGWYRHVCCPEDAMPQNCEWNGAPEQSEFGCDGKCGNNQFKLNRDTALDPKGEGQCFFGARYLCCDSAAMFSQCQWSDCQGPIKPDTPAECPGGSVYQTYRLDKPNGKPWCSDTYVSSVDGSLGSPYHDRFKSGLCCPSGHSFSNCAWTNTFRDSDMTGDWKSHVPDLVCKPRPCSDGKVKVAGALNPPPPLNAGTKSELNCDGITTPPGTDPEWSYCCDPPSRYEENWPVDPKYLWEKYYNNPEKADVVWEYSNEHQNNNLDGEVSTEEDGSDAYGFVMLDGPEGSIDNDFATTQTVVRRSRDVPKAKRSVLTTNQTRLDTVFDHADETLHVYCNYPAGSRECQRIFIDGAEDTIIRLPDHVGEGPFARIVSMKSAHNEYQLPDHHLEHRSLKRNANPVYEVKIDYNFHLIKPKRDNEPVNMRVDYTNLMGYWDEMTDSPASRMKRGVGDDGLTQAEWRSRVQRAVVRDSNVRKRDEDIRVKTPMDNLFSDSPIHKRWWGAFKTWLKKLTTVTESSLGVIEMGFSKTINLFRAQWGCPGQTASANLQMDLEANLGMDATYAYYLSGTFIPPSKPETFAYFGMRPTAYLGLHLEGNAQMQTTTGRKKIIDTLSYPGLAVKGIAAVGPTLDIYGEIKGKITLHGEADAGARVVFGKAEVYWPQNDDAKDKYEKLLGLESDTQAPGPGTMEPVFEAGVALDAQLDIIVTPEAHIGIKIGGGKLVGGASLMDAQLTGYVTGDLKFQAHGDYDTTSNDFNYSFGAYLVYNLGYKATAEILNFIDWALSARQAYSPDKTVKLYEKQGTIPMSDKKGRAVPIEDPLHQGQIAAESMANGSISPYLDPATDLFRRDDEDDDGDPMDIDPEFTQSLTCPPGSRGDNKLPELRFNCGFFSSFVQGRNGKTDEITGLCKPILGIPSNKRQDEFTFSNSERRTGERYRFQCGKGESNLCSQPTKDLQKHLGSKSFKLECDEFPWKSSEQGGDYIPPDSRTATCVASYQNNWHGECLRMMGEMRSNWAKLESERTNGDNRGGYWVQWRTKTPWTTPGFHGPENSRYQQRLKEYPSRQPMPDGVPTRNNDRISWQFKRNYRATWISQPPGTIDGETWGGATSRSFTKSKKYTGPAGMDAILCAINHFGQDDVYRLPKDYNALCRRDGAGLKSWGIDYNMAQCQVRFSNPSSNTKRSIGTFGGWEVESVHILEDDV